MNNEQILKKAIEKAVERGWRWLDFDKKSTLLVWRLANCDNAIKRGDYYFVIFSHDFAKAFFLDKWREMLQNMVVEEEPLKFLEKYL